MLRFSYTPSNRMMENTLPLGEKAITIGLSWVGPTTILKPCLKENKRATIDIGTVVGV